MTGRGTPSTLCALVVIATSCDDSPLCDLNGHERSDHRHVFIPGGPAGCAVVTRDFQSLSGRGCACIGLVPRRGALSDAAFAGADPDLLTLALRIVPSDA